MVKLETIVNKIERSSTLFLFVLLLLATFLRFYQLNSGLWYDEIKTVLDSVRNPLYEIVTTYPSNNIHLFYSVLAKMSILLFSEHPWSIRLPSVLFGIASIPLLYLVGTAAANRFEAFLSTAILTVSYHHIWFSQNARGYTALLFFVMLATYLLIQWLNNKESLHIIAYGIVAALGSYTHLTMVFVVITHAAICTGVLYKEKRETGKFLGWQQPVFAFLLGGVLTIVLYVPLFFDMTDFFTETATTPKVATPVWAILAAIKGLQIGFGAIGGVALGALFFTAGALSYYKSRPSVFFLFMLPAPVTLALGVALGRPIFPRFIFFVIGFVLLIVIRGAVVIGEWLAEKLGKKSHSSSAGKFLALILTVAAIVVSACSLPYGYAHPKQDYKSAIEFVIENQRSGETIAVIGITAAVPIQKYFGKPWTRLYNEGQLNNAHAKGEGLILLFTFPAYIETGEPEIWKFIQNHCKEIGEFEGTIEGGNIYVYRCAPSLIKTKQNNYYNYE